MTVVLDQLHWVVGWRGLSVRDGWTAVRNFPPGWFVQIVVPFDGIFKVQDGLISEEVFEGNNLKWVCGSFGLS